MEKEFEYEGYTFNISVELRVKSEKHLDGNVWHEVTVNCMGFDNYYRNKQVLDEDLERAICVMEKDAKKYVNSKKEQTDPLKERLTKLGFK